MSAELFDNAPHGTMDFSQRVDIVIRNRKRHHPVPEVSVGRRAELHVEAMLAQRLVETPFDYFAGLRVPHRGRRREIDFVVAMPDGLWVVELKNWSGFVGLDERGRVIQHRSGGRGVVDHGRLLSDMQQKESALKSYLRRDVEEVPQLQSMLVFYDRRVGLDDRLVENPDIEVMRLPEFVGALPAPPHEGLWSRWFEGSTDDRPSLPGLDSAVREATEVLSTLGSWDLLALHGGQIVSGDVVGASSPRLEDRNRFKQCDVDVPRSLFDVLRSELSITVTALERDGDSTELTYGFDESIQFHCAGDPEPKTFSLRDVEALKFGYVS